MNVFRAHRLKFEAAQRAAEGAAEYGGVLDELREQLFRDKRTLKAIRSVKEKEQAKAHMLPRYAPYVEGVLESGKGAADEVFSTLLIWTLDAGDIPKALDMAAYALRYHLPSPDEHQRTTAEIVTEETIAKLTDVNGEIDVEARPFLERVRGLVADQSIVDPVRAKLEKSLGIVALVDGDPIVAAKHFRYALELNPSSGCKKLLTDAEKQVRAVIT